MRHMSGLAVLGCHTCTRHAAAIPRMAPVADMWLDVTHLAINMRRAMHALLADLEPSLPSA